MKTEAIYRPAVTVRPCLPYPNAATKRQVFEKVIDHLLIGAIGIGSVAIILFLLALA